MFGAVNPKTGELIIYNEYYVPEKTLPYHAEKLKELTDEIPTGLLRFMVIDPATKNRMNDVINGRSIISHFQEYGLYFQPGNNDLDYGLAKVNSYIESGKLKIYKTCLNLIGELINYKYPELDMDSMHENRDEKPIKQNDHASDGMRYLVARLPDDPNALALESHVPPDRWGGIKPLETLEYEDNYSEIEGIDFLHYY